MKTAQLTPERIESIKFELMIYAFELNQMFVDRKSLREISRWSYDQRESGRNIPYMRISDTSKVEGTSNVVIGLWAEPTNKQKELKAFFNIEIGSGVLTKYTLRMDLDGVRFEEKNDDLQKVSLI